MGGSRLVVGCKLSGCRVEDGCMSGGGRVVVFRKSGDCRMEVDWNRVKE